MENQLIEEPVKLIIEKVDVGIDVATPQEFPWKYEDNSVKEIVCTNIIEYIPGKLRGKFMDEIYRILVPDGKISITVLYWTDALCIHDYMLEWPPLAEQSFLMFNKDWRKANNKKVDIICNFEFTYGYTAHPDTAARNDESRSFFIKHYNNSVQALHLNLTKKV